jgi:hypothetical protein
MIRWEDFGSWITTDPEIKINYPGKTIGPGASYSWKGKDGSDMKTLFCENVRTFSNEL